ncbi:MAG: TonB-dependent receptor domain-containing protein [Steroidobacteraceae bacterium]
MMGSALSVSAAEASAASAAKATQTADTASAATATKATARTTSTALLAANSNDWTPSVQSFLLAQATAAPGATGAPAASSAAAAPAELEEVTVTGTRIQRPGLKSISPLVTVTSVQLQQQAGINVESYLNKLPNFNPAYTPTTENEDVQPDAVNTVGIADISLRGLGPNRNLVLINGHRTMPINALMVTDINGIPQAMIQSIQTITGGASTTYGPDAVSGVVNFILRKDFQGAEFNYQDSITQAGDGDEMDASALVGTNFADNKGNVTMGLEYYNRQVAFQKNRSFFTNSWSDPNATGTNNFSLTNGYNGWEPQQSFFPTANPSVAALSTVFAKRTAAGGGVCLFGNACSFDTLSFNYNNTPAQNSIWFNSLPIDQSGYTGPQSGNGFGLMNAYDGTVLNTFGAPAPAEQQVLKWNDPLATITEPQTRYSFWADGNYHITPNIDFYSDVRFATSKTTTLLDVPTTAIYGWEAQIPFNAATDSPILPTAVSSASTQSELQTISAAFAGNPAANAYSNPNYIAPGAAGAQHPVPWQLAMLLLSRGAANGVPDGGSNAPQEAPSISCLPEVTVRPTPCPAAGQPNYAPTSWILSWNPAFSAPPRSTVDQSTVWQIDTGVRFPLFADWTGDIYYSRGQSSDYENALGTDSLQRYRTVLDSPDYGAGESYQGNANGANPNFGTSVPATCTSGFYDAIFGGASASADCMNAFSATLQTYTAMEQDDLEANFQGSIFRLPAGEVSAALGFEYLRDAGQFMPDNLQSTGSFLDEAIGLYPLGGLDNEIASRQGYLELYIPVLKNLPLVKELDINPAIRYTTYPDQVPNTTTFKLNLSWQVSNELRLRGGFNRAVRAPNLGELYLGEQEFFGGAGQFGDPCSLRSIAPFGAGDAAADLSPRDAGQPAQKLAGGQTTQGAISTYLICQAQMQMAGGNQAQGSYYAGAQSAGVGLPFAWVNEVGNSNLKAETADTWTAGFTLSDLGQGPWLQGLNATADWWQIHIKNAIELDSIDYANYLCYGTNTVTTQAQAVAQAETPACLNVPRLGGNGGPATSLLQYDNSATIGVAGVDLGVNWIANLEDIGVKHVPGEVTFSTRTTILQYFRTKQSSQAFDTNINWKDSFGPTLSGTNGGAYGYRIFTTIGYVLPSFSAQLRWTFYPSINSAAHAQQEAIVDHNKQVAATGQGYMLSWTPDTSIATPAWSEFDLSATYTVNHWLQIRGGIDNLLNTNPPITGATTGVAPGSSVGVCSTADSALGCTNPTRYALANDGAGFTNAGFYDVYGRTFYLGLKASF